jgi:hypothetical protein
MVEWKNPYRDSNRDSLHGLAFVLGLFASVAFCLAGIWIGLVNEYGDWTPGFGRFTFAIIIVAIPFVLPLTLNFISIPLLYRDRTRTTGFVLLGVSCVAALVFGIVAVQLGNF